MGILVIGFTLWVGLSRTVSAQTSGCGASETQIEVKAAKSPKQLSSLRSGVHVVLIQDDSLFRHIPKPTTRVGLDGKWVGGTKDGLYTVITASQGDHDLCVHWQNSILAVGPGLKAAAIHVELQAETTYYFRISDVWEDNHSSSTISLEPIDSAEGALLMEKKSLSMTTIK